MLSNSNKDKTKLKLKRPVLPFMILVSTLVIGTIGYKFIWTDYNSSFLEAFYMTFTTISTIGYREVYPLGPKGMIFTILIATLGISSLFFIFSVIMENLFTLQILDLGGKKKMKKVIDNLNDHIILVGFGRVGKIVAEELIKRNETFIVIDTQLEEYSKFIKKNHILAYEADATNDEALKIVGIERAKSLIVATSNSAITVFVVLSAREMNKELFIVARSDEENTINKLKMAGADRIINPYATGGEKLANVALNSHVLDIVDSTFNTGNQVLKIEKYQMGDNSKFNGKAIKVLGIRQNTGATIIGIIRNNEAELSPTPDYVIMSNDQLIILGTIEQLIKFNDFIKE